MRGISHYGKLDGYIKPSTKLCWEARQMLRDTGTYVPSWLQRYDYKALPSEALKKHRERVYKAQAKAREQAA